MTGMIELRGKHLDERVESMQVDVDELHRLRDELDALQDGLISRDMVIDGLRKRVKELEAGQGEPVGYFLNQNLPGEMANYQQVQAAYAGDSDVVALYTSATTIPEGWMLVPFYPTEPMMESARLATESEGITTTTWLRRAIWDAMIASALKPKEKA